MGDGQKAAQEFSQSPEHAKAMENFRDQLLIVCMKRLADKDGRVLISVEEADDTYQDMLAFSIQDGVFHFQLEKKA